MYKVEERHYHPYVRKGDMEDTTELIYSEIFKTRKAAKEFIESKLKYHKNIYRDYHRGNEVSYCSYTTDKTWFNEGTGETCTEEFTFELSKVDAK